jgi:hypothetical protein
MKTSKIKEKLKSIPEWLHSIVLSLWCFWSLIFGVLPIIGILSTSVQLLQMDEIKFNKYKNTDGTALFNYSPDRKEKTIDEWKQNNKRSIIYYLKVGLVGLSISGIGFIFLVKTNNQLNYENKSASSGRKSKKI